MELFSSLFYLLSAGLFLAGFYCLPKAERAQNALVWLPVALLACECWAGFFAGIFTLVYIPVHILSIGATYLAGGLVLWFFIRRRKAMQKYTFTLPGSVFFALLTLFVVPFGLVRFTPDSPISYSTSDPAVHLIFAMDTLQSGSVYTADGGMYFGSLTNALFIQMLESVFSGLHVFKPFILKDLVNLWVMGASSTPPWSATWRPASPAGRPRSCPSCTCWGTSCPTRCTALVTWASF